MKRLAIITGATSGIGYELAKNISHEDVDILLISRSLENLQKVQSEISSYNKNRVEIFPCDLSKNDFEEKLIKMIDNRNIKYLINNAGFGDYGDFIDCNIEKQDKMIELNIKALIKLSHLFLNVSKDNVEKTYLLNVASVASFMPGPLMSVYYASKAFVLNFTKAIAFENVNKNIVISALCPGPTDTNFVKSANLENSNFFDNLKVMSAKQVADIAYAKLKKGKEIIVPGLFNKIAVHGVRFLPSKLITYLTYRVMKSK